MCTKFTPFSDINSPKAIPFGAAHTSNNPNNGVIPNPPTPEPRTHKSTVSLPGNFRAISYGSRLDRFGFKIKIVCFARLVEAFYLFFFKLFLAMRDKILSSDYCVPEKLGPLRTLMHLSIETPKPPPPLTPGKYGALMGVTKGFGTFLCPRGWGICCFFVASVLPVGWGLVRF